MHSYEDEEVVELVMAKVLHAVPTDLPNCMTAGRAVAEGQQSKGAVSAGKEVGSSSGLAIEGKAKCSRGGVRRARLQAAAFLARKRQAGGVER